jgi:predicted TIM-barrel fold metal-dependent hydrolase
VSAVRDDASPLAGREPLIDAHAHFYHAGTGRTDWAEVNAARFRAGDRIGITYHVASVLGSFGFLADVFHARRRHRGNDVMLEICAREPDGCA